MDYHNGTQPPGLHENGTGGPVIDIHEPFTTAERMEQLNKIDDVLLPGDVFILKHTNSFLQTKLTIPYSRTSSHSFNTQAMP